jgi:hypothetical protein
MWNGGGLLGVCGGVDDTVNGDSQQISAGIATSHTQDNVGFGELCTRWGNHSEGRRLGGEQCCTAIDVEGIKYPMGQLVERGAEPVVEAKFCRSAVRVWLMSCVVVRERDK